MNPKDQDDGEDGRRDEQRQYDYDDASQASTCGKSQNREGCRQSSKSSEARQQRVGNGRGVTEDVTRSVGLGGMAGVPVSTNGIHLPLGVSPVVHTGSFQSYNATGHNVMAGVSHKGRASSGASNWHTSPACCSSSSSGVNDVNAEAVGRSGGGLAPGLVYVTSAARQVANMETST